MAKKEYEPMVFSLDPSQVRKFDKWATAKRKKDKEYLIRHYTYCFTPTGIGDCVKIKCSDGTELDVTDINNW